MKGRGQANFDNGGQGLAAEREAGAAGNRPILPSAQGEGQQKGGSLRGHCGVGRAHGSQGQDAHQEKVQQEVDGGGRRDAEKGDFGVPCSLAEGRVGQVTEGERRAQAEHTQVGAGICHGLGGDRQQLEQAGGSQGPCHSHQKGDDQGSGEKGPRGFLQAGGVLGAGLLGDADHAPCGQVPRITPDERITGRKKMARTNARPLNF